MPAAGAAKLSWPPPVRSPNAPSPIDGIEGMSGLVEEPPSVCITR